MKDASCPICNADIPLSGDEKPGEEVYCTFCSAPLLVKGESSDDELLLEDDY